MFNNNSKSFSIFILVALVSTIFTVLGIQPANADDDDDRTVEITFVAAEFQCDGQVHEFSLNVYEEDDNDDLIATLNIGESTTIVMDEEDINELGFEIINHTDPSCMTEFTNLVLAGGEQVPQMDGAHNQASIQQIVDTQLQHGWQSLFLTEFGTTDTNSSAFDMQDTVIKVDYDVEATELHQQVDEQQIIYAD